MLTISREEYADLLRDAEALSILKRVIYSVAERSFLDSNRMTIKREYKDDIIDALRILDYQRYTEVLDGLDKV